MPSIQERSAANTSRARREARLCASVEGTAAGSPAARGAAGDAACATASRFSCAERSSAAAAVTGTAAVAIGCLSAPAKIGDAAILLDAHRHFRADQIEAFGAHMAAQQAHAGDAHFGLRRARHHGAVGIAHHDVADAHRGAAVLGALDLGAADLDVTVAAEILLDGGREPGRHDVELDRSAGEPPPKRETAEDRDAGDDADSDRGAPEQTRVAREETADEPYEPLRDSGASIGGQWRQGAAGRRNGTTDSPRERCALPVLVRHAPRASPRPWCFGTTAATDAGIPQFSQARAVQASAANLEAGAQVTPTKR